MAKRDVENAGICKYTESDDKAKRENINKTMHLLII